MAKPQHTASSAPVMRCAIYTRKSTEEGLDQAFNSLDAQREACAAYIVSQRHEGWTLVKDSYDDGGFSGGNMERPGLKRLLADVQSGKVNVIVVYKVDRLTRALSDFAKIVEVLDKRGASFVSITQSFNTTTSMGRLTLNVLLSFAQFEREVTGERIRDKIAASKAKGMWMGGNPPLGYDVVERKLVVNRAEAETVRHIMQRYVELGTGRALLDDLRKTGITTKASARGGIPFSRGPLFHLLGNRIYLGDIVHKGTPYPGEHDAIVSQDLWDAVQRTMAEKRVERSTGTNVEQHSLLAGKLMDGEGRKMSPSHVVKGTKRYRYYITHSAELADPGKPVWRVPAHDIEAAVVERLKQMLQERRAIASLLGSTVRADQLNGALQMAQTATQQLDTTAGLRRIINASVSHVHLADDHIAIELHPHALLALLGIDPAATDQGQPGTVTITAQAAKVRRGKETRLVIADNDGRADGMRDDMLVGLLAEARAAYNAMLAQPERNIKEVAADMSRCRKRFAKLIRIAMLAPDIVESCIDGTQPVRLTARALLACDLPIAWPDQRKMLGFR